ncbi:MAG: crossover junction endodeoxyribonuclease RuvC [Candidatus Omnitrophica bacterium]|nr:crossover junction endodeoxyribonuclease RuvC [Candidatus Omnitrophota bacterium]
MIVLAVDVGLKVSGYVVCRVQKSDISLLVQNEIKSSSSSQLSEKLGIIFSELKKQVEKYKVDTLVVEILYSHHKHPMTLGVLSEIRGVVLLLADQMGLAVFQYSPTRARKSFLGCGRSDSAQVKRMAESLVGAPFVSIHTADAYSLVVAFSHDNKYQLLKAVRGK